MSFINLPQSGSPKYKPDVSTYGDLPSNNNTIGDIRLVISTGTLYYWDGSSWLPTTAGGGTANYKPEAIITLSSGDITTKSIVLSEAPTQPNKTRLEVIGGIQQEYGVDFTVSGSTLSWNGLGLDGVLEAGDKLLIVYN